MPRYEATQINAQDFQTIISNTLSAIKEHEKVFGKLDNVTVEVVTPCESEWQAQKSTQVNFKIWGQTVQSVVL